MKLSSFDVLIVGAGPAGATTAILLAQAGWSVALVEKKQFPRRKVCGEFISATNLTLLQQIKMDDFYLTASGPEICRVGFYAADVNVITNMPTAGKKSTHLKWGRALGREHLDTALVSKAVAAGATLWQPGEITSINRLDNLFSCSIIKNNTAEKINARLIIMANGSWEHSPIRTQNNLNKHKPSDLLGFKAHFINSNLAKNVMPLLAFPGGYGGIVHTDSDRISFSCCIRRDTLQRIRKHYPNISAGDAVLEYIKTKCREVNKVITPAQRVGRWLSCGPIQPGIRKPYAQGIFYVGNSAGEAHPIVAEGISMAMQSAWLLSYILIKNKLNTATVEECNVIGKMYTRKWRTSFALRIYAASFFAQCAMRPSLLTLMVQAIKLFPGLLTVGAKLSGKIKQVVLVVKS